MVKILEEISWIRGIWVNKENREIDPKPIGLPKSVELRVEDKEYNLHKIGKLINRRAGSEIYYSLEDKRVGDKHKTTAVQFYVLEE